MSKLTPAELAELNQDVVNGTLTQEEHDEIVGAENKIVLPAIVKKNGKGENKTAYHDIDLENPAIKLLESKYREAEKTASEAREKLTKACLAKLGEAEVVKALLAKHANHELIVVTNFGRLAYAIVPTVKRNSKATALKIA